MCDRDAPREIPSLRVRSKSAAISELPDKMLKSECKQIPVEDETESVLPYAVNNSLKQQNVSKVITVHSSLAAISAVCKEVTDMDLQTDPTSSHTYRKRTLVNIPLLYGSLLLKQEFPYTLLQTGQALYLQILMIECYIPKSLNKYKN